MAEQKAKVVSEGPWQHLDQYTGTTHQDVGRRFQTRSAQQGSALKWVMIRRWLACMRKEDVMMKVAA